jgi:hypothetical protein
MVDDVDEKSKYKEYCKSESDEAYATISKSQEEYDKQLLTLSTGLLAVLIAFIKDVVHLDSSAYRPLLYLGLVSLGLTIVCVIASFQVSIFVLEKVRIHWQEHYNGNTDHEYPDTLARRISYMNWAGGGFFVVGIGFALAFIIVNLATKK